MSLASVKTVPLRGYVTSLYHGACVVVCLVDTISASRERTLDTVVSWTGSYDPGPFIARFNYPVLYCGNKELPDMTVIPAVWSPEGFAIAADGLQFQTYPPARTDHAQKIFHTPFRDGTGFAYACAGTCHFGFQSGRTFDFLEATKRVTDDLASTPFPDDPADYFNEIGKRLFQELVYPMDGSESATNLDLAESRLLFVGYANGSPLWAELVFSNSGTRFAPPVLARVHYSPRYFLLFAGSNTVFEQMQTAGKLFQPLYLSEAIDMVRTYVQTCVDSNASIPDCANFGGHIHVVTVTKDGFSWAIPPIED